MRDPRSPAARDRDRILYSPALRRLAGITQVVSPTEGVVVHNRLTHTLKVAQLARRLGEARIRTVVDFIASLTEQQATRLAGRIVGSSPGTVLDTHGL